jgi:hypothetical protein
VTARAQRTGDTIAAARRRLPMTEVDATTADNPEGWPEGKKPGWFWRSHEDGVGNNWTGGRPTVQWTRPGATPVAAPDEHHHH